MTYFCWVYERPLGPFPANVMFRAASYEDIYHLDVPFDEIWMACTELERLVIERYQCARPDPDDVGYGSTDPLTFEDILDRLGPGDECVVFYTPLSAPVARGVLEEYLTQPEELPLVTMRFFVKG